MFAPHCPTCRRRVLLGTDQIERFAWEGDRRVAVLRCFCGTLVDWNQRPAADDAAPAPSPTADAPADIVTPRRRETDALIG